MPRKIRYQKNPEQHRRASKEYYRKHRRKCLGQMAKYRKKHRRRLRKAARERYRKPGRKEHQRAYVKDRYHNDPAYRARVLEESKRRSDKNRALIVAFIDTLKANTPCADCGKCFNPECMDFDHLPKHKKSINLAQMRSGWVSLARVKAEIKKCELVCACCHRTRTKIRNYEKQILDRKRAC